MPYFEFQYWPYNNHNVLEPEWKLIEFPKKWAEHTEGELNIFPYYNNTSLNWYLVEIEEENTTSAFQKAWNIISSTIRMPSKKDYYRINYFWDDTDGDIEIDWTVYPTSIVCSSLELNHIYQFGANEYYVIINSNIITAVKRAIKLIEGQKK